MSEPSVAELEAFQLALAHALREHVDAATIRARLLADPASAPFRAYVESFDLRMIEIMGRLARRWGSTSETFAAPTPIEP